MNKMFFAKINVLSVASVNGQSGDTVTEGDMRDAFAKRIDDADDFVTWHKWDLWRIGVVTITHDDVGEANTGGENSNPYLSRSWFSKVVFDNL
jgi:hypothetical protein